MWSAPIHDTTFAAKILDHLESNQNHYGTAARMKGMLTVAKEVGEQPVQWGASAERCEGTFQPFLFYIVTDGEPVSLPHTSAR